MTINPVLGKREWAVKDEYYDYYQEVARSSYADMLHDKERNEKYHAALKKAIKSMREQGRAVKVLDIGTGTGLLSMMAANAGADSVVACEMFRPVAKCAEDVIKQNGFEDKIKIVLKHSTDLTVGPEGDLKEKANILVAEVFDTELIGEGALKTFLHAGKYLLEPDSIVIPSAASVYAQIVESPLISKWNTLFPVQVAPGKVIIPPKKVTSCHGSAAVHDVQMSQIPQDKFTRLTDPICVFEFSFTGEKSIEMNETFIKQVPSIASGSCEIVFMWWTLKMDMDGDIILNNGPKWVQPNPDKAQWRDHWMQAIYYLPEVLNVSAGDKVTLTAYHDEYSLWFAIPKASNKKMTESPTCNCLVHVTDSHARIGMKNDTIRNDKYVAMLKKVISPSSVCLSISDGSLLPFMAAKLGAKKVFTIESNHFHHNMIKSYIEDNDENNIIKIIAKEPANLSEEDFDMEKVDVLLTEPYFVNSIHPWELMRFWHLRTLLAPYLASNVSVIPENGKLKGIAVDFEDLWKIRAPVKNAEGFNLSKFDEMIQRAISIADASVEPHPVWEYPCTALSEEFNLQEFDFSKSTFTNAFEVSGEVPISSSGICNAIVLWTDYNFEETEITTGPIQPIVPNHPIQWCMNSQQGVYFLHPPISVIPEKHILNFKINFTVSNTTFVFTIEER
ncbi:protein arginine N-methyltransferase 7 [Trichonephila inaurata madagascariensis]|uniref:Protein arginine N-methyltransferase n=1 Tax=Trichonephila inaurata madagascariensis TaxID=2747483 RepID=A0A8X7CDI4_9ARAC|nr:protein arginine N-methyltransferase 7 [Trichonephila inaurata madagascariensis]